MTDEAKAVAERLREDYHLWLTTRIQAADLIETQAREIERLRVALQGISEFGGRHTGHGYSCHLLARAALGESHD